jgi:hypothetical protein
MPNILFAIETNIQFVARCCEAIAVEWTLHELNRYKDLIGDGKKKILSWVPRRGNNIGRNLRKMSKIERAPFQTDSIFFDGPQGRRTATFKRRGNEFRYIHICTYKESFHSSPWRIMNIVWNYNVIPRRPLSTYPESTRFSDQRRSEPRRPFPMRDLNLD